MDSAKRAVEAVTDGVKKVAVGGEGKKGKKDKKAADAGDAAAGPLELSPPPSCEEMPSGQMLPRRLNC